MEILAGELIDNSLEGKDHDNSNFISRKYAISKLNAGLANLQTVKKIKVNLKNSIQKVQYIDLKAGQAEYDLADDFDFLKYIHYGDRKDDHGLVKMYQANPGASDHVEDAKSSSGYYACYEYMITERKLRIYPIPSEANFTVKIQYIPKLPRIYSEADIFELSDSEIAYVELTAQAFYCIKAQESTRNVLALRDTFEQKIKEEEAIIDAANPAYIDDTAGRGAFEGGSYAGW